ncbi:MAG: hypothetical protein ABFD59_06355, partial [Smithella sp.]
MSGECFVPASMTLNPVLKMGVGDKKMKALLDTNIIIHREANHVVNRDIGTLFKWLDKGKYTKFVHPVSIQEIEKNLNKNTVDTFKIKLDS